MCASAAPVSMLTFLELQRVFSFNNHPFFLVTEIKTELWNGEISYFEIGNKSITDPTQNVSNSKTFVRK